MWEALVALAIAVVGGFITLGLMLGSIRASIDTLLNNHLPHIYNSIEDIQSVLMKRD